MTLPKRPLVTMKGPCQISSFCSLKWLGRSIVIISFISCVLLTRYAMYLEKYISFHLPTETHTGISEGGVGYLSHRVTIFSAKQQRNEQKHDELTRIESGVRGAPLQPSSLPNVSISESGKDPIEDNQIETIEEQFAPSVLAEEKEQKHLLPNVFLMGSDAVAEWLFSSGVCRPMKFEPEPDYFQTQAHFFDSTERYEKGIEFYAKRFEHCGTSAPNDDENRDKLIMDATQHYFDFPERVLELYAHAGEDFLSDLKIIVVLQEPVHREFDLYLTKKKMFSDNSNKNSWFSDVADENGNVMSFEQYAKTVLKHFIAHPSFKNDVDRLKQWVALFGRDKVLVLNHDELFSNPKNFKRRISEFLGVNFGGQLQIPNWTNFRLTPKERDILEPLFEQPNKELSHFMASSQGPPMEQRPFPTFSTNSTEAAIVVASVSESLKLAHATGSMPKILWMYWEQGLDHLQSLSDDPTNKYATDSRCVEAMMKANDASWNVVLLNKQTINFDLAPTYVSLSQNETLMSKITRVKMSDLLRLELISKYGGVWSDTSVCPLMPLDDVIPKYVGSGPGGFYSPRLKLSYTPISEMSDEVVHCEHAKDDENGLKDFFMSAGLWLLASSTPHNILVENAFEIMHGHLLNVDNHSNPYYLAQCALTQARIRNPAAEAIWEQSLHRMHNLTHACRTSGIDMKYPCFVDGNSGIEYLIKQCSLIKKQQEKSVREYVLSPQYLEDVMHNKWDLSY